MPDRHPPKHEERLIHALKPLAASTHDLHVCGVVNVATQAVEIAPYRHVDEQVLVLERANRGRVAVFGLQAPDETGGLLGERVDAREVSREIRHQRRVHWPLDDADIQLRKLVAGHRTSLHRGRKFAADATGFACGAANARRGYWAGDKRTASAFSTAARNASSSNAQAPSHAASIISAWSIVIPVTVKHMTLLPSHSTKRAI